MDFSTVTAAQWGYVAVLWLGMMVGKAMGMETRVLSAFIIIGLVAPSNFGVVAIAALFGAMTVKIVFQFTKWAG